METAVKMEGAPFGFHPSKRSTQCARRRRERNSNRSVYGKIKTAESSHMGHETVDKRVYCHDALHLREKLQSAGYK